MDINEYLLADVVRATTPRGETAADAGSRREAIAEMFHAFDPRDAVQAMMACQCVALHFLMNAAMRDGASTDLEPEALARARAGAMAISKTLHQWVTRIEKIKRSDDAHAREVRPARIAAVPPEGRAGPERAAPPTAVSGHPEPDRGRETHPERPDPPARPEQTARTETATAGSWSGMASHAAASGLVTPASGVSEPARLAPVPPSISGSPNDRGITPASGQSTELRARSGR